MLLRRVYPHFLLDLETFQAVEPILVQTGFAIERGSAADTSASYRLLGLRDKTGPEPGGSLEREVKFQSIAVDAGSSAPAVLETSVMSLAPRSPGGGLDPLTTTFSMESAAEDFVATEAHEALLVGALQEPLRNGRREEKPVLCLQKTDVI